MYCLRREAQEGCREIHFLGHPILVVTWYQASMEEVAKADNDCPCYLPAVLDREVILVVLMKGHSVSECQYTFVVCTFLSKKCKEVHHVCCDILLERAIGVCWLSLIILVSSFRICKGTYVLCFPVIFFYSLKLAHLTCRFG